MFVDATAPEQLYRKPELLRAEHNVGFLKRCVEGFRRVNFAAQASGRIYVRIESGVPVWIDPEALRAAIADEDTRAGLAAVSRAAVSGEGRCSSVAPQYLRPYDSSATGADGSAGAAEQRVLPTLGAWGTASPG